MCVFVACMYEPAHSGTLPLSAHTWAARGVFCFVFCFGEPSPVLRKCCRKQWELTPSSASVPLKKGSGLSGRREEGGRRRGVAVSLGMSRPCGWLSTHTYAHSYKHTLSYKHTATVTTGLSQTIPVSTILLACSK